MADNLAVQDLPDPSRNIAIGASSLGTLFTHSGPAAPIVLPIFATFVLAKWVYDVYKQSRDVLQRLMAYIVDLILVLQLLFLVVTSNNLPISGRLIKVTFAAYHDSVAKSQVHTKIREHVTRTGLFSCGDRDSALNKIIELIRQYHDCSVEMVQLKAQILQFEFPEQDEQWDVSMSDR